MAKPVRTIAKRFIIFIALCCVSLGCSTRLSPAGVSAYESCQYDKAIEIFKKSSKPGNKDYLLYELAILSSAMHAGQEELAESASLLAQKQMWSYDGQGKGTASLISAESLKIFKGEPFEKAMASVYSGIVYFNRGDLDNARAAFSKANMAIEQKSEGSKSDFALSNYLLAKTFFLLGDLDNAKISLSRAHEKYPDNPYLTWESLKKDNVIFLMELGNAPKKSRTGPGNSLIQWIPDQSYEYSNVYVSNGEKLRGSLVGDLYFQATSKDKTAKDTIQAVKGVTRDASILAAVVAADKASRDNDKTAGWVALGAGLFALANRSEADTRQWELLPGRIEMVSTLVKDNPAHIEISGKRKGLRSDEKWYYNMNKNQGPQIVLVSSKSCPRELERGQP